MNSGIPDRTSLRQQKSRNENGLLPSLRDRLPPPCSGFGSFVSRVSKLGVFAYAADNIQEFSAQKFGHSSLETIGERKFSENKNAGLALVAACRIGRQLRNPFTKTYCQERRVPIAPVSRVCR